MKRRIFYVLLAVLSLAGIGAVVLSTAWGVGLTPDSLTYIDTARNLLAGKGFVVRLSNCAETPMTHYPPLFPLLLAGIGLSGLDPLIGARWLNAVIFGMSITLMGLTIRRYTPVPFWLAPFGSLAMLTSFVMLRVHSTALTEPIFIFFALLGLWLLDIYGTSNKLRWLLLSGVTISLAFLSRYAGVALVATGLLVLFVRSLKRGRDVVLFTILTCFPVLVWVRRNYSVAGTLANRQFMFHPINWDDIQLGLESVARWFYPARPTSVLRDIVLLAAAIILLVMILLPIYLRTHYQTASRRSENYSIPYAFMAFILIYTIFLFTSISFFDAGTPLDIRVLAPLFAICVVVACWLVYRFWQAADVLKHARHWQIAILCGCSLFVLVHSLGSGHTVWKSHRDGLGYASRQWKQSAVINYLKSQPDDVLIYSNAADALHLLTGRCTRSIPARFSAATKQEQSDYSRAVQAMGERLARHNGLLAYFRLVHWRDYLPSEQELIEILPLELVIQADDGAVYKVRD